MSDELTSGRTPLPLAEKYVALSPSDRRIVAVKVAHPEYSNTKIAEVLGTGRVFIGRRLATDGVRAMIQSINEIILNEAKDMLIAASTMAASTLVRLMKGRDDEGDLDLTITPDVQLRAAVKVLEFLKGYTGDRDEEGEEVVYEMIIDSVGNVKQKKAIADAQDTTLSELDIIINEKTQEEKT